MYRWWFICNLHIIGGIGWSYINGELTWKNQVTITRRNVECVARALKVMYLEGFMVNFSILFETGLRKYLLGVSHEIN